MSKEIWNFNHTHQILLLFSELSFQVNSFSTHSLQVLNSIHLIQRTTFTFVDVQTHYFSFFLIFFAGMPLLSISFASNFWFSLYIHYLKLVSRAWKYRSDFVNSCIIANSNLQKYTLAHWKRSMNIQISAEKQYFKYIKT